MQNANFGVQDGEERKELAERRGKVLLDSKYVARRGSTFYLSFGMQRASDKKGETSQATNSTYQHIHDHVRG